ncbi:MAG: hypothetical protein U1D33_03130, partial [bacterium]|nr:hypothetical protein [bacterium]
MELKGAKRSFWEYVIVGLVVAGSLFLALGIYAKRDFLCKAEITRLELLTLRNYVTAYFLEHRQLPSSIEEAVGPRSTVHGPWSDAFGNPYQYDPKKGWVSSAT